MGSRLRTRDGMSGLYLNIGAGPGGKLFRMNIPSGPTCAQDLHNWAPLVDRSGINESGEESSHSNQIDRELEHDEGREVQQL